jgi:hypothetical protein
MHAASSQGKHREHPIDYRWEDRKEVGERRGDIGDISWVLNCLFQITPFFTHEKRTVQPEDAFEVPDFKTGV